MAGERAAALLKAAPYAAQRVAIRCSAILLTTCCLLSGLPAAAEQQGLKFVGRWVATPEGEVATYAGSTVLLRFHDSASVAADLTISNSRYGQESFISVTVDGGKPVRMELTEGQHPGVVFAANLSRGAHVVAVRKEGEPRFGALHFAKPRLEPSGKWDPISDYRPIVEVIGDSDATGICVLGPDSPLEAVSINEPAWASEADSWVGRLEADLAGVGHPVDMVDLAISGSTAGSEAVSYDDAAPDFSDVQFGQYSLPGNEHASLVLMWGGGNDRHGGGDLASGKPVTYARLSPFERGIFDQLTKIFARNPDVRVVLLDYIDVTEPDWRPAYAEIEGLFSDAERQRMFVLPVYDQKGKQDACEADPKGHPNMTLHESWAAQILVWMMSGDNLVRLGLPEAQAWDDH
jgi:hypothetical protein